MAHSLSLPEETVNSVGARSPAPGWVAVLGLLGAAPLGVAAGGYLRLMSLEAILGLPPLPQGFGDHLRAGSAMLAATLQALPGILAAILERPEWWAFRGAPAVVLYTVVLSWCARRSRLRAYVEERLGDGAVSLVGIAVGLSLVGLAIGLAVSAQAGLQVQDLLIPGGARGPATTAALAALVRAGRDGALSERYMSLGLAWLATLHLTLLYARPRSGAGDSHGRMKSLGAAAGLLLVVALLCLPSSFALVQVAAGFPVVEVVTTSAAGQVEVFDGLLLERGREWVSIYETDPPRLRLLTVAAVRELRLGPRRSPFAPSGEEVSP